MFKILYLILHTQNSMELRLYNKVQIKPTMFKLVHLY